MNIKEIALILYNKITKHICSIMTDKVIYPYGSVPGVSICITSVYIYILNTLYKRNDVTYYIMKYYKKHPNGKQSAKIIEYTYYEIGEYMKDLANIYLENFDYFKCLSKLFIDMLDSKETDLSLERSLNYILTFNEECKECIENI